MDAGLSGEDEPKVLNPKKIPLLFLFLSQHILKTFQKCKKYKDRWEKPLSSVHIGGK